MTHPHTGITTRPAKPTDLNFILNSYLKSYRRQLPLVTNETYFRYAELRIKRLVESGTVTVACSTEDEDQIIGWICHNRDADVAHWIFVKYPFRKMGVARLLLAGLKPNVQITHTPHVPLKINGVSPTVNPFLLEYNV